MDHTELQSWPVAASLLAWQPELSVCWQEGVAAPKLAADMAPDQQVMTLFPGKHGFSSGGRTGALQQPKQQAQQDLLGWVSAKPGEVALQVVLMEAHVLGRGALAPNDGLQ